MTNNANEHQILIADGENIDGDLNQSIVKCAICQDAIAQNNNSFVDLCLHQFCFGCLQKWCEVKAECPLCKQKVEKIIHSVKSPQTYKEYIPLGQTNDYSRGRNRVQEILDILETLSSDEDENENESTIESSTELSSETSVSSSSEASVISSDEDDGERSPFRFQISDSSQIIYISSDSEDD